MAKVTLVTNEGLQVKCESLNGQIEIKVQKWEPQGYPSIVLAWVTMSVREATILGVELARAMDEAINYNAAQAGF